MKLFIIFLFSTLLLAEPNILNEENERIMQVQLSDGSQISNALISYSKLNQWYLPLGELTEGLGLAIQVSSKLNKAEGFVIRPENIFLLDLKTCEVLFYNESGKHKEKFDCNRAAIKDDEIFIDHRLLQIWMPLDFKIDTFHSKINIHPREKLPEQLRQEREEKVGELKKSEKKKNPNIEELTPPFTVVTPPFIDQQLSLTRELSPFGNQTRFQQNTEIGNEILGFESYAYLLGNEKKIDQWQATLTKKDVKGKLMGPLGLTEIKFLFLNLPPIALITEGKSGRGAYLSNYPLFSPSSFGKQNFEGPLTIGWEVELYQNDILLDRKTSTPSGRYAFLNVPLFYGRNLFRLVFYGPRGEQREETQSYFIDNSQVRKDESHYRVGYITLPNSSQHRLMAQFEQSLYSSVSASGGVLYDRNPNQLYGYLGATTFLSNFLVNLQTVMSDTGGKAVELATQTAIGNIYTGFKYDRFFNYTSELLRSQESKELKDTAALNLSHSLPFFYPIGMNWELSRKNFIDSTHKTGLKNFLTLNSGSLFWNHELGWTLEERQTLLGKLNVSFIPYNTHIRLGMEYQLEAIKSIECEGQRRITEDYSANILVKQLIKDKYTQLHFMVSKIFNAFNISLDAAKTGPDQYTFGTVFAYSFGVDSRDNSLQIRNEPLTTLGSASVLVYIDENQNGIRDMSEPAVKDAHILLNQREHSRATDENGKLFLTKLTPQEEVEVSLSRQSFSDPFLKPSKAGYIFVAKPGKTVQINLPVSYYGEVDGQVSLESKKTRRPKRNMTVELYNTNQKLIASTKTDIDGYYLFENVASGNYLVKIPNTQHQTTYKVSPDTRTAQIDPKGSFDSHLDFVLIQ